MVLNKSKWDHKAKIQYLRKHNLTQPKRKDEPRRKWSAKKSTAPDQNLWLQQIQSGEDYDEWTDTDDVILNHFYPNISEDNLPEDEKKKLKTQIIATIRNQFETTPQEASEDESDGIYLGTRPQAPQESPKEEPDQLEIADLETKLGEFIVSDFGSHKPRSLLKHHDSTNLLEEYGMSDYRSTVKDHDYNAVSGKKAPKLDHFSADDLHGFRIGESLSDLKQKPVSKPVRELSAAEMEEHSERSKKSQNARFHDQIKRKFASTSHERPSYLEINNFNPNDEKQMSVLNSKLSRISHTDPLSGPDLDDLLGYSAQDAPADSNGTNPLDLLEHLESSYGEETPRKGPAEKKDLLQNEQAKPRALYAGRDDEQFLDDLLGG